MFISKFFNCNNLVAKIASDSKAYESVGEGRSYELVIRTPFYPTNHKPLSTDLCGQRKHNNPSSQFGDTAPGQKRARTQVTAACDEAGAAKSSSSPWLMAGSVSRDFSTESFLRGERFFLFSGSEWV
jgi:hypothetical protein